MKSMLSPYLLFLAELEKNNNREWFDLNRARYKALNEPFQLFVGELIHQISQFDPQLKFLTPKDCTYRINRDIRFSNDKTPYKTYLSAAFGHLGKNGSTPAYYFELKNNGQIMIGGGWYMLDSAQLYKLRQAISEDAKPFLKILKNPEFKTTFGEMSGEKLKTTPKGFNPEDPQIELLRYKNYLAGRKLNVSDLTDEQIADEIILTFKTLYPFVDYLRQNS
jgi:uncharacterized protein (TIGR02453 family)